jgi:NAD(P)-dependent dehydrogenase (short-subunit alcohol dehydrogenase family)
MEAAGASVYYYEVDVRDDIAFGELIGEIYRSYGRLDGVIHGAGVIEDRLIEDKHPDSFDRVFDTKVKSALTLATKLRSDSLRFLVFFSSVAGRFGNRGQSDYAAANEVLNKLAIYLDNQWPGRVLAINWGPWRTTGMASAEVQRQFTERGVQLIPPSAGCRLLDEELRFGHKGQVEVIIGDGPWERARTTQPSTPVPVFPLLDGALPKLVGHGLVEVERILHPAADRYLQDHRLDQQPVFPMAMAMELMAEVAQKAWPEWKVVGIRSLRVLRGIIVGEASVEIRVMARSQAHSPDNNLGLDIDVQIVEKTQPNQPCYRATVQMREQFLEPVLYDPGFLSDLRPFPMTVDESYRRWLFHGPSLQGIATIEGINDQGVCGILIPSTPARCLFPEATGHWIVDPVLLDCSFQLAILWERAHHDMTPLPSRFTSYCRFGSLVDGPIRCCLKAQSSAGGQNLLTDIYFIDGTGQVMAVLEEMEFSCSKALNRLAGSVSAEAQRQAALSRGGR